MLCVYMGVWRSSTSGRKKVSSVVFRDCSRAKRRRRLSMGTSAGHEGRSGGGSAQRGRDSPSVNDAGGLVAGRDREAPAVGFIPGTQRLLVSERSRLP